MQFTRLALCAAVFTASAVAGDVAITPGFKLAAGGMTGNARDITQSSAHFGIAGQADFKLSESSAITTEIGYHWLPGSQYLAESYVRLPLFPKGYVPGATYRDRVTKADGQGFELGATYRYSLNKEFYLRGGFKVGFYRVSESNVGTELTAAPDGMAGYAPGQIYKAVTISNTTEKKTVSPGVVAGVGYLIAPNHAVELNVSNVRIASESVAAKTGIAWEVAYCMHF